MALPIDPEEVNNARTAADYIERLIQILPVMGVGGVVAVLTQGHRIFLQRTWPRRIFMCLSVVGVGFVSGGIAVLGLSLFLPAPTVEFDILAAAVAGSAGQKTFDIYSRKLFGIGNKDDK